mmetsp:Transcript_11925/g.17527  ORF Transcript_11925/g.17527 Transcript_11925/m.17527 type:complete len:244 (+) Transcript_11925:335-1066(+)
MDRVEYEATSLSCVEARSISSLSIPFPILRITGTAFLPNVFTDFFKVLLAEEEEASCCCFCFCSSKRARIFSFAAAIGGIGGKSTMSSPSFLIFLLSPSSDAVVRSSSSSSSSSFFAVSGVVSFCLAPSDGVVVVGSLSSSSPTRFSIASATWLQVRSNTRCAAGNSVPKTAIPDPAITAPNGVGNGIIMSPTPTMAPPATATPVLRNTSVADAGVVVSDCCCCCPLSSFPLVVVVVCCWSTS